MKPDNLGFNENNEIVVFDFRESTCVRSRTTNTQLYQMQQCIGTLRYMAPEVALGQAYAEKVDVYSFSLIVWGMISDEVPYDTITNKILYRW